MGRLGPVVNDTNQPRAGARRNVALRSAKGRSFTQPGRFRHLGISRKTWSENALDKRGTGWKLAEGSGGSSRLVFALAFCGMIQLHAVGTWMRKEDATGIFSAACFVALPGNELARTSANCRI